MSENYKLIEDLARKDATGLVEKGKSYGDSWKKRGGVGAFMMLARKWDRIENLVRDTGYDVFEAAAKNDGDIIDDIEDLRRYLLLVQAHVLSEVRISGAPKIVPPSPWKSCDICGSVEGHGNMPCPFLGAPAPSAPAWPAPPPAPPTATPVPPTSATVHGQPAKLNQCVHCGAVGNHAGFPCPSTMKNKEPVFTKCGDCLHVPCICGEPTTGYVDQDSPHDPYGRT